MLYGSVESLNSIPETNITLNVNQLEFKQTLGKKGKKKYMGIAVCITHF